MSAVEKQPFTLVDLVKRRATTYGETIAYTFLADGSDDAHSITWAELDRRAREIAESLRPLKAFGQPVLLALNSGLSFVESLFACWYAGAIAVPVSLPRHQRVKHRLDRIVADAGARLVIGTAETHRRLDGAAAEGAFTAGITWIDPTVTTDPSAIARTARARAPFIIEQHHPAVLQYTSGSTGSPRGVLITHANLVRNSALIAEACGHRPGDTIAGWLPLFHDMGLVGLVIQAAFAGTRCVFMPPERFLMRPWAWLQMISDYRVCSSPAPNFAYDLCVDKVADEQKAELDLSCWRNALNGSEPVRSSTLDRFADAFASCGFKREAFFPCYGLAEATLFVTGPSEDRRPVRRAADGTLLAERGAGGHVACGRPFGDTRLAIVDPHSESRVPAGIIGEIWVAGESGGRGYWNNPEATRATFNARLSDAKNDPENSHVWLRTGDLGFIADGQLFITGRLREMIIVAGRNHFPVDLERTAEAADPVLAPSGAVAFPIEVDGTERLVIVAEVRREYARSPRPGTPFELDIQAVCRRVRAAVAAEHEITPYEVVLLRPGAVPRTTSGKISHRMTRDAFLTQTLERFEVLNHAHALT